MPYSIVKNKDGSYKVKTKKTGKVHAKKTTKSKAKKQIKKMHMEEHKMPDGSMMKGKMHDPEQLRKEFMGHG